MEHRSLEMAHGFCVVAGEARPEVAVMVLGGVPLETLNVYVPPEYRFA